MPLPELAELLRTEKHRTVTRTAEILAELADELEGAASRTHADRSKTVADNIADLRERSGHLRFLAATVFPSA